MVPLFKPYMPDLPQLGDIINSNALAYGEHTKAFEKKLQDFFGTPYVITTNSFNTAISVACTTLGLSFGDEVVVSPMACLASTQPYSSSGFIIKWCDIDPKTGTLDPQALKKAITPKTKAIIHNHYCGYPGYIDEVNDIAKEYGIPVIDDGIECFGSEYKGKRIGNCGTDVTVFSFNPVRMPNTIDGGAVIFKSKDLYEKSLRIRDCGIDRTIFRDELGEINPCCDISEIGYSATMSNVNGYIGSCQMEFISELIQRQRENAKVLMEIISNDHTVSSLSARDNSPNYWVYGLLANRKTEKVLEYRSKGLYASGVHINNNIYSVFGAKTELPGTEEFYNHFVAIPSGWWVLYDDIKKLRFENDKN